MSVFHFKPLVFALAFSGGLVSCGSQYSAEQSGTHQQHGATTTAVQSAAAAQALTSIADRVYTRLQQTSTLVRFQKALPITEFRDSSLAATQQTSAFAREILTSLDALPWTHLSHDQQLFAQMIRYQMEVEAEAERFYWYGFQVTPYQASFAVTGMHQVFTSHALQSNEQRQRYLGLVKDYARWIGDLRSRILGQAQRGIRIPKPAIPTVIETWQVYRGQAQKQLQVASDRLLSASPGESESFQQQLNHLVQTQLLPTFDALTGVLNDDYMTVAPEQVGLHVYQGGKDYYLYMVKHYGGPLQTPEHMHRQGLQFSEQLKKERARVREQLGFKGSEAEFHQMLRTDRRFQAQTPAEVEARYMDYMARIEPLLDDYFLTRPKAPYGVRRATPAVEKGMTYGYYQIPSPADDKGYYIYNGSALNQRTLITAQHLIYHELIPGHHFHLALELENTTWHPLRRFVGAAAFAEGWAEYSASLAEDMNLYSDPYDYYGHLLMQSFLTSRVAVDTGMNYFGWPLEKARAFMRENTFESDVQIATETIRYSTDLPAQALAYRLVRQRMQELRSQAEKALGDRFNLAKFNSTLLTNGSLPMSVLEEHIDWFIRQEQDK